jgi:hypothetical protein
MENDEMDNKSNTHTTENICKNCGKRFIIRKSDYEDYNCRKWFVPERCPSCRRVVRAEREAQKKAIEDAEWQKTRLENQINFEKNINNWRTVSYEDIVPVTGRTLFIIGNGFDMMHGANSSYYSFRDSLGKHNSLREDLETFTTVNDIWADFENALAHINMQFFSSRLNIDTCLDIMGAYDADAGAAEFFMATEFATQTVSDIVEDLPRYFYNWVSKLSIATDDRPLQSMFQKIGDSKVLNFNYTEFVEDLYHVSESSICYIHGCRRKRKGQSRPQLILGHAVGASDVEFEKRDRTQVDMRSPVRREMIYAAQEIAIQQLDYCDKALTKDCSAMIQEHDGFFDDIKEISRIITIGHSLSEVDWPYFAEIISRSENINTVEWYFGCHGLHDLENLEKLIQHFGINKKMVTVFRTDVIKVKMKSIPKESVPKKVQKIKQRCISPNGRWKVQTVGKEIQIVDADTNMATYSVEFPANISSMFFLDDTEMLFMVSNDYPSGIFVFGMKDDSWQLLYELEKNRENNFLTKSLYKIFLYEDRIIFVYNNRVREHSLIDGKMIQSKQFQGARNRSYPGKDVTNLFRVYKR